MAYDQSRPQEGALWVSSEYRDNFTGLARALPNMFPDSLLKVWAAGDSAAPTGWAYTAGAGTGAAIVRAGTGLADTSRKIGPNALKLTGGSTGASFADRDILGTASFDVNLRGAYVWCAAYVRATTTNAARIGVFDGVDAGWSAYAPGTGSYQWLTAVRLLDASATRITVRVVAATGQNAWFSALAFGFGDAPLAAWSPGPVSLRQITQDWAGNATAGTDQWRAPVHRPGIVRAVQLTCGTAPASQALILDLNSWDGSAFTSMFTSGGRPQIAAAGRRGGSQPDGTYARRCLSGVFGTTLNTGGELSWDTDQVGSGTTGANVKASVIVEEFPQPIEVLRGYNEL